eukprot:GHVN01051770.1.p1 GENE.GHVN01051770.1~~GHVN01051770.1.p1  ORF type:complete len:120 (+),score=18.48 GHVN01051770.1:358-717(+)
MVRGFPSLDPVQFLCFSHVLFLSVVQSDEFCKLIPNCGSDKIWVWTVNDSADGELNREQFGLKFGQLEQANVFKEKFEEATKINGELFKGPRRQESDSTPDASKESKEEPKGSEEAPKP